MTEARAPFSIGDVVSRSFHVVIDRLGSFATLAAITLVPFAVMLYAMWGDVALHGAPMPTKPPAGYVLLNLAQWAAGLLGFGATIHATVTSLDGRPIDIAESVTAGVRRALPLLCVALLFTVVVGIGYALLIVPGLILTCVWYMAFPVAIVERRGVFGALGRAAALSKGYRLSLFGLGVVALLLVLGGYLVAALIGGIGYMIANAIAGQTGTVLVLTVMGSGFYMLFYAVFTAMIGVAYHDLRTIKEGGSPEQVASIFA